MIGLALVLVGVGLYLAGAGRTLDTLAQDALGVLGGAIVLTPAQDAMRRIIEQQAAKKGAQWLVPALVANAYAESRLDPLAIGDGGRSVGLFQLHDEGLGAGLTVEQRQDPRRNADEILAAALGERAIVAARGSATHADLAALIAQWVERCAACGWQDGDAQLVYRRQLVTRIYGATVAQQVPT